MAQLSQVQREALSQASDALRRAETTEDAALVLEVASDVVRMSDPLREAGHSLAAAQDRLSKLRKIRT